MNGDRPLDQRSTLRTFVITSLSFGTAMTLCYSLTNRPDAASVVGGVVSGLLFGGVLTWFTQKQVAKFRANPPDTSGSPVLLEGPANHFAGIEAVGGYLVLAEDRLAFRSHKMNVQNHESAIPLSEIVRVTGVRTLGLVPNGILVERANGQRDRFVVFQRSRWLEGIERAKASLSPGHEKAPA